MLTGSCSCNSVRYEVDCNAKPIVHCHCATCRKTHGSAFSSVMAVPRDKFRWISGESLLAYFESSPGKFRRFCSRCGSHIMAERIDKAEVLLRLGCLDSDIDKVWSAHIWVSDGAGWYDHKESLREYSEAYQK